MIMICEVLTEENERKIENFNLRFFTIKAILEKLASYKNYEVVDYVRLQEVNNNVNK